MWLVLIAWALMICLVVLSISETAHFFATMLMTAYAIMNGLPQALLWVLLGAVMTICALITIARLARQGMAPQKARRAELVSSGRLKKLQSIFNRAESSRYYQQEAWGRLRSLAIQLVALKKDISEEAARQILFRAFKNDDSLPRALNLEGKDRENSFPSGDSAAESAARPRVLDDIEHTLDALSDYGGFSRQESQA
jgi:hypothetical protein